MKARKASTFFYTWIFFQMSFFHVCCKSIAHRPTKSRRGGMKHPLALIATSLAPGAHEARGRLAPPTHPRDARVGL